MMARAISNVLFLSTMAILVDCFLPPVLRPPSTISRAPRVKMATDKADVCRGDVPTPGWVRLAQRNLSKIRVGDPLPDACVRRLGDDGNVEKISVKKLFGDKKGVLVGVPGAFTPTCSSVHLPEYVEKSEDLAAKGAELVCFVSVNDPFVMMAWEESQKSGGKVLMLSDGNGDLSASLGMLVDLSGQGMGLRCKRFMLVVEGGKVTHAEVGDEMDLVRADAAEKVLSMKAGAGAAAGEPRKGGLLEKLLGREVAERAAEAESSESGGLLPA